MRPIVSACSPMRNVSLPWLLQKRRDAFSVTSGALCVLFSRRSKILTDCRGSLQMSDHQKYFIRAASPSDIEALIELCAEHAAYEGASYDPRDKGERLSSALFSASPRLYAWVVEQHG